MRTPRIVFTMIMHMCYVYASQCARHSDAPPPVACSHRAMRLLTRRGASASSCCAVGSGAAETTLSSRSPVIDSEPLSAGHLSDRGASLLKLSLRRGTPWPLRLKRTLVAAPACTSGAPPKRLPNAECRLRTDAGALTACGVRCGRVGTTAVGDVGGERLDTAAARRGGDALVLLLPLAATPAATAAAVVAAAVVAAAAVAGRALLVSTPLAAS